MIETRKSQPGMPRHQRHRHAARLILFIAAVAGILLFVHFLLDAMLASALGQLRAATNVTVTYSRAELCLCGIILRDVRIAIERDQPQRRPGALLRAERVDLRPSVRALLSGRRGFPWTLRASLYGGVAKVAVDTTATGWNVRIESTAIDLAEPSRLLDMGELSGTVRGRLLLTVNGTDLARTRIDGSWSIAARQIESARVDDHHLVLPPLVVSHLDTTGYWAGRRAEVLRFDASGSFGDVALTGKIVTRTPLEKSAISMRLTHTWPTEEDPQIGTLLRMLLPSAGASGSREYRVTGTISAPAITLASRQ